MALGFIAARFSDLDAKSEQFAQRAEELAKRQRKPATVGNTGVTSLAVMAFLARGHLPGRGRYGEVINRGVDYILTQQLENGLLISRNVQGRTTGLMYEHSISTLLLGEVSGMVDPVRQRKVDDVLSRALLVLLQAQKVPKSEANAGGWRYSPGTTDSDLSLTGWSIMALRAAKLNGAAIPDEHIEMAVSYILNCHTREGGFSYVPGGTTGTTSMTGVAVLCLELCGEHGNEDLLAAGDFILSRPPQMTDPNGNPVRFRYYAWYYCGHPKLLREEYERRLAVPTLSGSRSSPKKQLASAQRSLSRLIDAYSDGVLDRSEFLCTFYLSLQVGDLLLLDQVTLKTSNVFDGNPPDDRRSHRLAFARGQICVCLHSATFKLPLRSL